MAEVNLHRIKEAAEQALAQIPEERSGEAEEVTKIRAFVNSIISRVSEECPDYYWPDPSFPEIAEVPRPGKAS